MRLLGTHTLPARAILYPAKYLPYGTAVVVVVVALGYKFDQDKVGCRLALAGWTQEMASHRLEHSSHIHLPSAKIHRRNVDLQLP